MNCLIKLAIALSILLCSVSGYAAPQVVTILAKIMKSNGISNTVYVDVTTKGDINAFGGGNQITIHQDYLALMHNPDEIAIVLAHELAHVKGVWSETAADIQGAEWARKAGYNVCHGMQFIRRVGGSGDMTHPAGDVRVRNVGCK